uniref:Glycosyltransferase n=1 Tax=Anaerolinea thermolimosa TaxID=229919 RepID=A0A7C4PN54_9CHLR
MSLFEEALLSIRAVLGGEQSLRILIPTIGTRGDVQPYIALALGLKEAGHSVTLATHPMMRFLIESYGVHFAPIGPDIDLAHETALLRRNSPHWMVGFWRVMQFSFSMLEQSHKDLLRLCETVDLVIVSHTAAGSMEADHLGLPTVSVTLFPQAIPVNDPRDSAVKRLVMRVAGAGMGVMMTRPLNQVRKRLGLSPMGAYGITSPKLNLIPLSRHVYPPHPFWETRHRMTGYWFAPSPRGWKPPNDLVKFLESGDRPVVVNLGAMAMSGEDALEAAKITLASVLQVGVRTIIQGWDEPIRQLSLPKEVFHAGSIPHDWLLSFASGLVHHGGFGTTAAGFRAGIPMLVIPHIIDQFIWGQKVAELGVGPVPIPRAKLTITNMSLALQQLQSPEIRASAAILGEKIRSEPDGVKEAVRFIEQAV